MASEKIEAWLYDAVEYMARTGASLAETAGYLDVVITSTQLENILRRKSFNRLLWEARHRYFSELTKSPDFQKDTAIGKLVSLAQRLEEEGDYDKAAECWFKVAKMQGWVGPENQVSVFGELSQADLDAIRKKLEGSSGHKAVGPN